MTDIAAGMSIAGASASQFNVGIDQLAAAIGTMTAVTQLGGETSARALRFMLANLSKVTTEIDGEIVDEESFTKVEAALNSVGVSMSTVRDGIVSLRNPMEIIKELAQVLGTLDKTDARRANILNVLGGVNRQSSVAALLDRQDIFENMLSTYASSAGSAEAEALKTAESIQGRLNNIATTIVEILNNIADSDSIKSVLSAFQAILDVLAKLTSLNTSGIANIAALGSLFLSLSGNIGLVSSQTDEFGSKLTSNFGKIGGTLKEFGALTKAIFTGNGIDLTSAIDSLNDKFMLDVDTAGNVNGLTMAGNSLEEYKDQLTDVEYVTANFIKTNKRLPTQLDLTGEGFKDLGVNAKAAGIKAQIGAVGVKIFAAALNTIAIFAATAAIQWFVEKLGEVFPSAERVAQRAEETTQKFKEQTTALQKAAAISEETKLRYNELSEGVSKNGENVSLTTKEYDEYLDIVSTITTAFPTLIRGYNDQGAAILGVKDAVEELNEEYEEQVRLSHETALSGAKDVYKDFANGQKNPNGDSFFGFDNNKKDSYDNWKRLVEILRKARSEGTSFEDVLNDVNLGTDEFLDLVDTYDSLSKYAGLGTFGKDYYSDGNIDQMIAKFAAYEQEQITKFVNARNMMFSSIASKPEFWSMDKTSRSIIEQLVGAYTFEDFDANKSDLQNWATQQADAIRGLFSGGAGTDLVSSYKSLLGLSPTELGALTVEAFDEMYNTVIAAAETVFADHPDLLQNFLKSFSVEISGTDAKSLITYVNDSLSDVFVGFSADDFTLEELSILQKIILEGEIDFSQWKTPDDIAAAIDAQRKKIKAEPNTPETRLGTLQNSKTRIEDERKLKEASGDFKGEYEYNAKLLKISKAEVGTLEEINTAKREALSQLEDEYGLAAQNSSEYKEIEKAIRDNESAIVDAKIAAIQYADALEQASYRGSALSENDAAKDGFNYADPSSEALSDFEHMKEKLINNYAFDKDTMQIWESIFGSTDGLSEMMGKSEKEIDKYFKRIEHYMQANGGNQLDFWRDAAKLDKKGDFFETLEDGTLALKAETSVEQIAKLMNVSEDFVRWMASGAKAANGTFKINENFEFTGENLQTRLGEEYAKIQAKIDAIGLSGQENLVAKPIVYVTPDIQEGWSPDSGIPEVDGNLNGFGKHYAGSTDGESGMQTTKDVVLTFTPILDNGETLSESALDEYVQGLYEDAGGDIEKMVALDLEGQSLIIDSIEVEDGDFDSAIEKQKEKVADVGTIYTDAINASSEGDMDNPIDPLVSSAESLLARVDDLSVRDVGDFGLPLVSQEAQGFYDKLILIEQKLAALGTMSISLSASSGGSGGGKTGGKTTGAAAARGTMNASSGDTLVGEIAPEILVRGNSWRTVGNNGAEMVNLKRGDIVFNHKDTEEILSGKSSSFGSPAGTAMASGASNAAKKKATKPTVEGSVSGPAGGKPTTSSGSGNNNSRNKDKEPSWFDWIEVRLKRLADITKSWMDAAKRAVGYSAQNAKLEKAIASTQKEITDSQAGYTRYMKQADDTDLNDDLKKKVREGEIDITKYDDETQKKIAEYKEWYDKAQDCKTAVEDLKQQQKELAEQKLDNIVNYYENMISLTTAWADRQDAIIDNKKATGKTVTAEDYEKLIALSQKEQQQLRDQRKTLNAELESLVKRGLIEEGSDAWYEYKEQLIELDKEATECETAIAGFNDAIAQLKLDTLVHANSLLKNIQSTIEGMMGLHEAQGEKLTIGEYTSLIDNGMDQIENLEEQVAHYEKLQEGIDETSEKYREYQLAIEELQGEILEIKTAQEEWNDAIIDLKIDVLQDLREELEKQNDAYEKRLKLEKALEDLERAKTQRTKLIYREDGVGYRYEADQKAVRDAQENLDDIYHEETLDKIDEAIDALEDLKDDSNIYDYDAQLIDTDWTSLLPTDVAQQIVDALQNDISTKQAQTATNASPAKTISTQNFNFGGIVVNEATDAYDFAKQVVSVLPNEIAQETYKK